MTTDIKVCEGVTVVFIRTFKKKIYLFIHERDTHTHRDRDRDTGRGRSRFHAGSPTWDLIPGLQDHALD